jgi:hypothetical protein
MKWSLGSFQLPKRILTLPNWWEYWPITHIFAYRNLWNRGTVLPCMIIRYNYKTLRYLWESPVGIATGWTAGVRVSAGAGIFLFSTVSRPALESTQPPIHWVPWALSSGVKRLEREADPSSAKAKNSWDCWECFNILTDNTESVSYVLNQHIACVRLNRYIIVYTQQDAKYENEDSWDIPPLPDTSSWRGASWIKHRDNFNFTVHATFLCSVSCTENRRCFERVCINSLAR